MKFRLLGCMLLVAFAPFLGARSFLGVRSVVAQEQTADFTLPATDDGLPGMGPIRR